MAKSKQAETSNVNGSSIFSGKGVYLSNFVAVSISLFVLVLSFAAGFFAKHYFQSVRSSSTTAPNKPTQQAQESKASLDQIKNAFENAYIKFGDTKRKVIFLEATDPSCPYCHIAAGKNPELNSQAGGNFKLVSDGGSYVPPVEEIRKLVNEKKASYAVLYRNGHGNGEMAMKALYCAYDLGKFWEAHDLIMTNDGYKLVNDVVRNNKSKTDDLVNFLASAVDKNKLKECLESGKHDGRLAVDTSIGDKLGFRGTPGFYVNDVFYPGAYSYNEMKTTVENFLSK